MKLIALITAVFVLTTPALAKPCQDAKGKFTKCPVATPVTAAPAGATAKCKDGTFSMSKTHSGSCSHHGGVTSWLK